MATYGLETTPGQVPFTGYTNTLGNGAANVGSNAGYAQFNGVSQGDDRIAKMIARQGGMTLAVQELLLTLLGATTGAAAFKTKPQVQGQQGAPGGLQTIETITLVNRATTANDLNAFLALANRQVQPPSYPPDLSGNGGGGKLQYAGGF